MCDVALDRSGKTRPEPKIHNESETSPEIPRPVDDYPLKIKEPSTIIQALLRLEMGRRRTQDGGVEPAPFLRPGHVFALIVLLGLIIGVLFVFPVAGLLMLIAFCLLISLPLKKIGAYLVRHRVAFGILLILFLTAGEIYEAFFPGRIFPANGRFSLQSVLHPSLPNASLNDSFYFIQEFSWPDTKGIQYVWPMPARAACEELLSKNKKGQMLWLQSAEKCIPDKGQYNGFFRYEPGRDWYATFQASGKIVNFGIFKLSDEMLPLGKKNTFHPVWLFAKSMLTMARNQNPPVTLTARIISPQGEVDMDTWQLKR